MYKQTQATKQTPAPTRTPAPNPFQSDPKYKHYTRVIAFSRPGSRVEYTIENSKPDYTRISQETLGLGAVAALAITPRRDHVVMITRDNTSVSGWNWKHYDMDMIPTLVSTIETVCGFRADREETAALNAWIDVKNMPIGCVLPESDPPAEPDAPEPPLNGMTGTEHEAEPPLLDAPEHWDGEPCTLPVGRNHLLRAAGLRFEYTTKGDAFGQWFVADTGDCILFDETGKFKGRTRWILRRRA